jgi:hypothetical protein
MEELLTPCTLSKLEDQSSLRVISPVDKLSSLQLKGLICSLILCVRLPSLIQRAPVKVLGALTHPSVLLTATYKASLRVM